MNASPSVRVPLSESRILFRCICIAIIVELLSLEVVGWQFHWIAHPQKAGVDTTKFIETQMLELPKIQHLTSPETMKAPAHHEVVISKVVDHGRKETPQDKKTLESNQNVTDKGPSLGPTHGPVAVFNPSPVIPPYLLNQQYKSTVVIEFLISGQGVVTPHLIGSSDNEELDALAIATAKRWQFRPAEKDGKPIDSKVRLRVVFEVN